MSVKIGITQKLSIIFFIFFLIFSGTVAILLFNVQRMVETTEKIVTENNKIDELSEILLASLLDMEANHKKLKILKKEKYSEYFEQSKLIFETALAQVVQMSNLAKNKKNLWGELEFSYLRHRKGLWDKDTVPEIGSRWVTERVVTFWLEYITQAKRYNQQDIEEALRELNERSSISARNGLYGFCFSIFVGFFGIWFLSRSIFRPLKTLAKGMKRISVDKLHKPISLLGGEEFSELGRAYNDMSRQLYEEENIRNEFIATLSHEIRTPLASIRESVNMIVEEVFGPVNKKQRKFLTIAGGEIQRINKLFNHLLNVSVLEAGVRDKKSTAISAQELVKSSTELFSSLAEKKTVSFRTSSIVNCPGLYGVREELQQVFTNIISNAIKYSPKAATVVISWQRDKNNKFILFKITDSGPGIPEDELSLVFTKYYRTENAQGRLDGVGLGLAIAQKIVTGYGGKIGVSNNRDGGCTFYFTMPKKG